MIDFAVMGTPRTHRADTRPQWQAAVRAAFPDPVEPLTGPLRLRIGYFYERATDLDTDNIIKPIQDALKRVAYEHDKTIVDVCARKLDRLRPPPFANTPAIVSDALIATTGDFVFVRVAAADGEVTFS
ncbi:RusA family crossover junction endodeoxyribonuclease [Candidatus Poriferisodalis sp.]|uniref:RusA family crossover junction endodeoxyribonuclease n=1 Tax=Candidatus Poriferisodalis sp. TaxID=3101277 RepID=UPI003D11B5BB